MSAIDVNQAHADEPLAMSAPLAREWARRLCDGCAWYHGFWQYLRLLDFVTTPRDHAGFYRAALDEPIAGGARRVLVSGTADYAMPACILWIFAAAGAKADLTALDLCPTPLQLCEWYAERVGMTMSTVRADILAYRSEQPFDVVATHSFLGRFSPEQRRELFARWHRLLRPGGCVVTVNRVRPDASEITRFTPEQAERFTARLHRAVAGLGTPLDVTTDALVAMAREYTRITRSFPVRSADDVAGLFEASGFRIEQLTVGPVGPRATQAPTGPTMSGGAEYARVLARRL
jgi:SAM-dependent methyltransferase